MQLELAAKQFKAADVRYGSQRDQTCGKCGKVHKCACQSSFGCHKCGNEWHYAKDCRQQVPTSTTRICFQCEQVGHIKANYPLLTVGPVQTPAPATLRITDGR